MNPMIGKIKQTGTGFPGRIIKSAVEPIKALNALGFAVKRLHHQVPAEHLLDVPVDMTQVVLLSLKVLLRLADHPAMTPIDSGTINSATRVISQLMVNIMISTPITVTTEVMILRQALAEGLVHRVDVVGEARQHFALTGAVKVLEGHAVDFVGDIFAESIGDIRRYVRHDPALDKAKHGRAEIQRQGDQEDLAI